MVCLAPLTGSSLQTFLTNSGSQEGRSHLGTGLSGCREPREFHPRSDDGGNRGLFFVFFDVATLDGGQRIDGSRLSFDAVIGEGGFGAVNGIIIPSGEDLHVVVADPVTLLEDQIGFPVPLDRLRRNGLLFTAAGVGSVNFHDGGSDLHADECARTLGIRPTGVRSGHRCDGAEVCTSV